MVQSQVFYTPDFELIAEKITPIFWRNVDIEINILRGDFNTGNTEDQDVNTIIEAKKGQMYWEPLIGYDAQRLQNGRVDIVQETASITAELNKDGLTKIKDLLIGNTSDPDFVNSIRPEDRSVLPDDSVVISLNGTRR